MHNGIVFYDSSSGEFFHQDTIFYALGDAISIILYIMRLKTFSNLLKEARRRIRGGKTPLKNLQESLKLIQGIRRKSLHTNKMDQYISAVQQADPEQLKELELNKHGRPTKSSLKTLVKLVKEQARHVPNVSKVSSEALGKRSGNTEILKEKVSSLTEIASVEVSLREELLQRKGKSGSAADNTPRLK